MTIKSKTKNLKSLAPILVKQVGSVSFSMFMRVARHDLELTQIEMAKKLNIAPGTLCDIEKGRQSVSPRLASKIAKMANLSEIMAVELALQDQLSRARLQFRVKLKSA